MFKIDENTIYDPSTGICYSMSEGWKVSQSRDEAKEAGEIWARVQVSSVHASGEYYGLTFEKEAAVNFWKLLNQKVAQAVF